MVEYASRWSNRKALEYTGETIIFGLPFETDYAEELRRLVESEGLDVWETAFLGTSNPKGPFLVVAELLV